MTPLLCPSDADLAAFHRGELPAADLDRVADHLEHCPACEAKLREYDRESDPALAALRRPPGEPDTEPHPDPAHFAPTPVHMELRQPVIPALPPEVPGYDLLELLGQGGMGLVHKARHRALKRLVALKRLRASSDWDRERFRREAEAVARLQHPNIVQIYDFGEHQGQPYLALEYVEGGTLAQLIAGKPQPARPAAELARTLARAMQYAHERGVVHRDLKPANILLKTAPGKPPKDTVRDVYTTTSLLAFVLSTTPKIADFGVAKCLDVAGQTVEGDVLGTPSYMAPEQARGRTGKVGPAADVYALGAILYELLIGRPPFDADHPLETIRQVFDDDPVPPSRLQPRLPRDLETIALKCLQKDPARRYATAAALADDLDRFLDGRPILARPASPWERLWRATRRQPRQALQAAAAAGLLLAGLALLTWQWGQAVTARQAALDYARAEQQARRLAERREARLAFDRGTASCEQGEVGRGLLWLAHGLELADRAGAEEMDAPLRVNLATWARQVAEARLEVVHPGGIRAAAYSPDGRLVATAGEDGLVHVWSARTGAPVGAPLPQSDLPLPTAVIAAVGRSAPSLAFTPEGHLLVGGGDDVARLWEVPGPDRPAQLVLKLQHPGAADGNYVWDVAVRPDGQRFLTAHEDGRARLWDASTGKLLRELPHGERSLYAVAFLPNDGRLVLTAGREGGVRVWEAESGRPDGWLTPEWLPVYRLAVSADGRTALTGSDHAAQLWDVRSRRPLGRALPHTARVEAVAFSPDGQLCATGDDAGYVRLWQVATRQPVGPLLRHDDQVRALRSLSPDGRRLAVGGLDGRLRFWDVPGLPTIGPALPFPRPVHTVALSADGAWLLTASEAEAQLCRADRPAHPVQTFRLDQQAITCAALSSDGRRIAAGGWKGGFQVWDRDTGPLGKALTLSAGVQEVVFSPDGNGLLASTVYAGRVPPTLRRWAVGDSGVRELAWSDAVPRPRCAAFHSGGRLLMIGCDDRKVRFFDWSSGRPDGAAVELPEAVTAVAFSPGGHLAAAGCRDGSLHLIDVEARRTFGPRFGHRDQVEALAFSPEGRTLVAGGMDRLARFWDVLSGLPLGNPLRHEDAVLTIAFHPDGQSPDGQSVWTGGRDQALVRWRAPAAPVPGTPEHVRHWAEVLSGQEMDADGAFRTLSAEELAQRRARLKQPDE
jgi:WD40 repeat protein/serine/threonine protein kinase